MTLTARAKSLVVAGAWLFLLGLIQGAAVSLFANPRMALSAHLTAVQSGMTLMILGMAWSLAKWSARMENLSHGAMIFGMFALWLGLTLAAATGASLVLPIAGKGYSADQPTELVVAALILLSSASIIGGWLAFAIGITKRR